MGGIIFLLGKPNIDIYNESTKNINKLKKSRILAIGDSLHHDIKGAIEFGIDSLLITSTGIHYKLFDKKNLNWDNNSSALLNMDIKPNFICSEFTF
jgi:ribonucleotide monophosphatase NagD (HAD superfamily)